MRRSSLRLAMGLVVLGALVVGSGAVTSDLHPAASGAKTAALSPGALGVYPGDNRPGGAAEFSAYEHADVRWVGAYLTGGRGWSAVDDPGAEVRRWSGQGLRMIWSVPILRDVGDTLEKGAAGAYDAHFLSMGRALVADGQANSVLRLGWEFGGDTMPWAAASDPGAFAAYWRRIVETLRTIPGERFSFDWNGGGGSSWDVTRAYPGNGYVDYVTADVYDQSWDSASGYGHNTATSEGHALAWKDIANNLNWTADFASAHGKALGIAEWGVLRRIDGHGGGDDPSFVRHMYEWMAAHRVAYEVYFDARTGEGDASIQDGTFPSSAATFRSLFA